ncbi:MAG: T9SS type A sorting domain-containing protein [Chitinophagaceae bacterium]|nr:T9SS type A sorting domain-containing protein [Chitinophagaceae bacterium]
MKKFTFLFMFAIIASMTLGTNAFGQITQVGTATTANTGTTSITINKPSGIQVNDVMIAVIVENDNSGGGDLGSATGLSGWTLIDDANLAGSNPEAWGYIYYKVAVAADVSATNYTFTMDGSSDGVVGAIVAFRGVDVTGGVNAAGGAGGPFDIDPGTINGVATDATLNATAISPVSANAAIIMCGLSGLVPTFSGWTTATSPGALTELFDVSSATGATCAVGAAWGIKPATGTTGAGSATLSASAGNGSLLIALKRAVPAASLSPSATQNISVGGNVPFTATATNFGGSGNYTYTWTATGATIPGANPNTIAGTSDAKTIVFPTAGTYTVSVSIGRTGETTQVTNTTTVNVAPPANSPVGCNGQFFISHGDAGDPNSTTSMEKLTVSGGTITANPFGTNPTGIGFNAIGINPVDGYMYGIRYSPMHLVKIGNVTPNNVNDLGTITNANIAAADESYAGCFDSNGDYYFMTTANEFYKISGINSPAAPLAATYLGTVSAAGGENFVDIAIDPTDGQMYGAAGVNANRNIYKVNKTNGALTLVGAYSGGNYIAALFFDEVGGLFGYRQDGTFQQINKTNAAQTQVGTAASYTYADGCSCSFGRVFHDLDFTANPSNQVCPTAINPSPDFPLTVSVTNQTSSQKTGLTYTLNISDPLKRFRFTESAATIKTNLIAAGVATASSVVTLSIVSPATGTNYNQLVVTNFQTGNAAATLSFVLQVELYSLGGIYNNVPLQSVISGLPAIIGSTDLSNDPGTIGPDDPTVITFCPGIILPVNMSSFTAKRNNAQVDLKWVTASEFNNTGFYIERTLGDNGNWEVIAFEPTLAREGISSSPLSYAYSDPNNFKGISQYRLRQVDIDGKIKYSDIRIVRGEDQKDKVTVFPNPSDGKVSVLFGDNANVIRDVSLYDMSGRVIKEWKTITTNSIQIENLTPGMYTLRIFAPATGNQTVEKIIVYKR